jgi:RND superfamily putative drug exporter
VLAAWALVLAVCAVLYPSLLHALGAPDYGVDEAESTHAAQLLERRFPGHGAEQDILVFYSPERRASEQTYREVVARTLRIARRQSYVKGVAGPYDHGAHEQVSADGHAAIAFVGMAGNARQLIDRTGGLQDVVSPATRAGVQVWLTGYAPIGRSLSTVGHEDVERAESVGVPVALVVLLVALGAAAAALVPLALAGCGLLLTFGVLALLARMLSFDSFLTTITTMIGVGIGIDYALFIVSRFREELARRVDVDHSGQQEDSRSAEDILARQAVEGEHVEHAVGTAIATSGCTILFSGAIVALALASLFVIRAPIFREFAIGAVTVVTCMVIVALTLLPAALAMLGSRINKGALPARLQPFDIRPNTVNEHGAWARWAMAMMRRPMLVAGVTVAVLLLAATPVLGLHYGIDFGLSALSGTPAGKGEQVLARSFGAGTLAPIEIVVSGRAGTPLGRLGAARARLLQHEIARDRRVAGLTFGQGGGAVLLTVTPSERIDSSSAEGLVKYIRSELTPRIQAAHGPEVLVGGATAKSVDLSTETRAKFPVVLTLVLGLSLLSLLVIFRSLVLPIKAVIMNLLATGATLGLVVMVFQDGHGEHLLGFISTGFIQVYLPLTVFALLFGLSMDYEVFLIRRMQETWRTTHDNEVAVATGVEHTARPISAAAAIMVAVFGSFVTADILELKQYGFALALAITLDVTLIRLVLVPALMRLFGAWNWWLPSALGSGARGISRRR